MKIHNNSNKQIHIKTRLRQENSRVMKTLKRGQLISLRRESNPIQRLSHLFKIATPQESSHRALKDLKVLRIGYRNSDCLTYDIIIYNLN